MSQSDFQMALLLQQQFEHEANVNNSTNSLSYKNKRKGATQDGTKSLIDPSWELIDPTPNIHILFIAFNEKYFWNKLMAVCVDWSKRMTSCAGICSYQGRGGLCRITLSEPLLKLRPRKDLIETLLHEMIHAYLFVTHNNRDRDGHGPEFHKHMYRINGEAGTNISVYHDFHDEVRLYKQHWWRCDGPCQNRKPYFGMVRRATNRAPGPNDRWWAEHSQNCGGTFIKVKEPEKSGKKKSQKDDKAAVNPKNDIRKFYPALKDDKPTKTTPQGTILDSNSSSSTQTNNNVVSFKDLKATKTKNAMSNSSSTIVITKNSSKTNPVQSNEPTKTSTPFTGKGQTLSGQNCNDKGDYSLVRNHWLNKFPDTSVKRANFETNQVPGLKKPKMGSDSCSESNPKLVECPICRKKMRASEINEHLDLCLENPESNGDKNHVEDVEKCFICDKFVAKATIEEHAKICASETFKDELIPCLVCGKRILKTSLNPHLDECMSDKVFGDSNSNKSDSECDDNVCDERKYNCPVCFQLFSSGAMNAHLNECLEEDNEQTNEVLGSIFDQPF